jgi:hypothetical protein
VAVLPTKEILYVVLTKPTESQQLRVTKSFMPAEHEDEPSAYYALQHQALENNSYNATYELSTCSLV